MDPNRWHQLKDILDEALDCPTADRAEYLDKFCGADTLLRREIESLLEVDSEKVAFLSGPAAGVHQESEPFEAGDTIGPYQIIERIGSGGMGVVYGAIRADLEFDHQVAIKVIRAGLGSKEIIRRFRNERQILAHLNHAYIGGLLDGGTTNQGLPYVVMEYVVGEDLLTYCDRNRLTLEQRIRLFIKICEAVQYAHSNLVVHRDLKPANILINQQGTPKLLDFGIAKLLANDSPNPSDHTVTILGPMTPEYASPEQFRGDPITTASDIYGLGLLLYELLTGRRPFQAYAASDEDLRRAVCDILPQRPSSALQRGESTGPKALKIAENRNTNLAKFIRRLRGDLDQIVLKALRKEPEKRYPSALQLAEDLERNLAGHPVLAAGGAWRYRVGKFLKRNWLPVVALSLIFATTSGFSVALYHQQQQTQFERDEAIFQRDRSEQISEFLVGAFSAADPYGPQITPGELVDQANAQIRNDLAGQPKLQATLLNTLGQVYTNMGAFEKAEQNLTDALILREKHSGKEHPDVADVLLNRANLLLMEDKLDKAEPLLDRALQIAEASLGEHHLTIAKILSVQSALFYYTDRFKEGETVILRAIAIQQANDVPEHELADSYGNLANMYDAEGRFKDSERLYLRQIEIQEKSLGVNNPAVGNSCYNYGDSLHEQGRFAESAEQIERAAAIYTEALGREHPYTSSARSLLGFIYTTLGRHIEAEASLREAMETIASTLGEEHTEYASILFNYGQVFVIRGEYQTAIDHQRRAQAILKKTLGEDHRKVAEITIGLADTYLAMDAYDLAEEQLAASWIIIDRAYEENHPRRAGIHHRYAQILLHRGQYKDAENRARQALAILEPQFGVENTNVQAVQDTLTRIRKMMTTEKSVIR